MVKKKIEYSFWKGIWKSLINVVVIFAPAILAFLANVPAEYTPIASIIAYAIKNYIQVKKRG